MDISKLKIGDKVHYIAHEGATPENGMVKEIPDHTNKHIRVVYNCAGEWDNFMNYTSQLTPIDKLKMGWAHYETLPNAQNLDEIEDMEYIKEIIFNAFKVPKKFRD